MTPTLKELLGRANLPTTVRTPEDFPAARDAAFAKEVLAARCSPATMALVWDALNASAFNSVGAARKAKAALEALNGTALNKQ